MDKTAARQLVWLALFGSIAFGLFQYVFDHMPIPRHMAFLVGVALPVSLVGAGLAYLPLINDKWRTVSEILCVMILFALVSVFVFTLMSSNSLFIERLP